MPRSNYDPRVNTYTELPLVGEIEGVKIYCDGSDGTFWAKVGRHGVISRKNLTELKRLISQRAINVELLVVKGHHSYETPQVGVVKVVAVEKSSGRGSGGRSYRLDDGRLEESWRIHLYENDPEAKARLEALRQEMDAAEV